MSAEKKQLPNEETTRFYLIFNELAKAEQLELSNQALREIEEIEEITRMVIDVNDEPPQFVTST
jgi:ribosomal protein L28